MEIPEWDLFHFVYHFIPTTLCERREKQFGCCLDLSQVTLRHHAVYSTEAPQHYQPTF